MIAMFENNSKNEKSWENVVAQFTRNGETIEHAISMFEVTLKIEKVEK